MLTQAGIEQEIHRIAGRLEERTLTYAELAEVAAEADVVYRVAHAKALLASARNTVSMREADATIECESLLRSRRVSEAVADACKEAVRSLRDQLSALQSLLRAVKDQT
jgi:hypothetical protein